MHYSLFIRSIGLWCCIAVFGYAQAQPQPGGVIAGVAVDARNNMPVRRTIITLSTMETPAQDAVAWTDSNGRFSFSYLAPGRYQLRARKDGYQFLVYGAKTLASPAGTIQLAAGEVRSDIVFRLQLTSSISGVVVGDDGEPVGQVQVMAMTPGFERQKRKLLGGPGAMTDSDGRYRLTGLLPGRYAIAVMNTHRMAPKLSSEVSARQAQSQQQLYSTGTQYYPGVERSDSATLIAVQAGNEVSGIDFRLTARPTVVVQGNVTMPPGSKPTDHVAVNVVDDAVNRNTFGAGAAPPDFAFQLDHILPGSYTLVAQATIDGKPYRGFQTIDVGPQGVQGLSIALEPGIDLVGTVSVEGPDAAKHSPGFVNLIAGDGLLRSGPPLHANVNKDGKFKLTGVVPGVWDINAGPIPPGGYIKSMMLGDRNVLTEEMIIRPSTTGALKIVLGTMAAKLEGDVTQGEQPARAVVVLAPEAKLRHVTSFFRVAAADEKGHFEIKSAVPGRYVLYAFEEFDQRSLQDPDVFKPFDGAGVALTLTEGANASQKLTVLNSHDPTGPGARK